MYMSEMKNYSAGALHPKLKLPDEGLKTAENIGGIERANGFERRRKPD